MVLLVWVVLLGGLHPGTSTWEIILGVLTVWLVYRLSVNIVEDLQVFCPFWSVCSASDLTSLFYFGFKCKGWQWKGLLGRPRWGFPFELWVGVMGCCAPHLSSGGGERRNSKDRSLRTIFYCTNIPVCLFIIFLLTYASWHHHTNSRSWCDLCSRALPVSRS